MKPKAEDTQQEPNAPVTDPCRCGVRPAAELHSCPFQSEINDNDDPEYCACCEDCTQECLWDI